MIFVVDTETTGLDAATDRVVEFAAVPMRHIFPEGTAAHWQIGEGASSLVYPGRPIPPEASGVHHIIDEDVENAPPLGRAVNQVLGPMWQAEPEVVFAAHNARYDKPFLPMLHEHRWIDTYRCALHVWPDAPNHKNMTLRYWLGIDLPRDGGSHRALADATVTAHLLARLLERRTLDELYALSRKAVVLQALPFGKHKGQAFTSVPVDYLEWLRDQKPDDHDVRFTVNFELKRRIEALKERGLV